MINFYTKNINRDDYTDIVNRLLLFNSSTGYQINGYNMWRNFTDNWILNIISITEQGKFKTFFQPDNNNEVWGVNIKKDSYVFVKDSKNPNIFRKNMMVLANTLLRGLYNDSKNEQKYVKKFEKLNNILNLSALRLEA